MPRLSILFLSPLLLATPASAQERMDARVADLCRTPPMDAEARDRLRRDANYARLLDGLAQHCPEVAILFAEWSVGDIGVAAEVARPPPEFVPQVGSIPGPVLTASIQQF
jgi:hypothetical protein